jgi:hypothetical protein
MYSKSGLSDWDAPTERPKHEANARMLPGHVEGDSSRMPLTPLPISILLEKHSKMLTGSALPQECSGFF